MPFYKITFVTEYLVGASDEDDAYTQLADKLADGEADFISSVEEVDEESIEIKQTSTPDNLTPTPTPTPAI